MLIKFFNIPVLDPLHPQTIFAFFYLKSEKENFSFKTRIKARKKIFLKGPKIASHSFFFR